MRRGFALALVVALWTSSSCELFKTDEPNKASALPTITGAIVYGGTFNMSAITATFAVPVTTYTVNVSPASNLGYRTNGGHFTWSMSGTCGTFAVGPQQAFDSGSSAAWSHPDKDLGGNCPNESKHPGVITVHWALNAGQNGGNSAYLYVCDATYTEGSAPGTGQLGSCHDENYRP